MSVVALTVPLELADGGTAYAGSGTGLGDLFVVNTTGYNSISIQLTGTWVGTVTFSISNDGVNWVSVASVTTNGVYIYPTTGLYFKAAITAYTSGTVTSLAYLRFQQVSDITVDADLADIDANTAATAANTATANTYLASIAADIGETVTPITASVTANGVLFTTDTLGYQTISVQLSGDWLANCIFQVSNDNVNFANVQGYTFNNYMNSINTAQDNGVYIFPVTGRYFQVVVANYKSGTVSCTAYLRNQTLAGIGETMLTQAMDQANNTPINVTYQNTGQQPAAASVPVTLSNENIQDKYIAGKVYTQTSSYVGFNILLPPEQANVDPGAPLDCLQYRSIYFQYNTGNNGIAGAANSVSANFVPEASNDLINWANVSVYRLEGGTAVGVTEVRNINPGNYGGNVVFGANLMMRYFRLRCSSFISGSYCQFTTMLRMTPLTYTTQAYVNLAQQGGSSIASGTVGFNSQAQTVTTTGTNLSTVVPPLIIGGTDRSMYKQEIVGAPVNGVAGTYIYGGPWVRQATYDVAGAAVVAGPPGWLNEEKTNPVNVRLERATNSQDSVQDLLQQILLELRALNYYTREAPFALNSGLMASLDDDPVDIAEDPTTNRYVKGN